MVKAHIIYYVSSQIQIANSYLSQPITYLYNIRLVNFIKKKKKINEIFHIQPLLFILVRILYFSSNFQTQPCLAASKNFYLSDDGNVALYFFFLDFFFLKFKIITGRYWFSGQKKELCKLQNWP